MTNVDDQIVRKGPIFGVRHVQLILMFLFLTVAYMMRINLSVGIVAMTDPETSQNPNIPTYDWDDTSLILSSFFWGYVVFQLFAGQLTKTYGVYWFLVASVGINVICCVLTPLIADKGGKNGLIILRVIQGLFQGFSFPSVHTVLGNWTPPSERSKSSTFVYSGVALGTIIAMALTGLISASWIGWPASFYIFGSTGIAWIILWMLLGANKPSQHKTITKEERDYIESSLGQKNIKEDMKTPWRQILTSIPVWAIIIANAGQNWGYSTLLTEIPTYMNKVMKFDMQSNGLLSAAPYAGMALLSYIFGPIADYLVNHKILSRVAVRKIMNTIAAALASLTFVPDKYPAISIFLLITAVGVNAAVNCGFQVNHIDLSPNYSGVLMGIANGLANIVSIVAPRIVGILVTEETDKSQWRTIFLIAAGVYTGAAMIFNIFAQAEIQEWNDEDQN